MESEIQRLWNENRRLTQERNVSQYELDIAREELHDKNIMIDQIRAEHEIHCRQLMKKGLQLIDNIPNIEPLKNEINHLHSEVTRLSSLRSAVEFEIRPKIQSVTEKIVAFCCQILQKLDNNSVHCQVLFLAPTIERAHQIEKVMQAHRGHIEVKIHVCVGDNCIEADKNILSTGAHLVVGTPLHVSDMLCTQNQSFHSDHIKMVVLDEADEMLSMGFDVQIHKIFSILPAKVEVVALYATMPKDALEITRKFMNKSMTTKNLWQSIVFL